MCFQDYFFLEPANHTQLRGCCSFSIYMWWELHVMPGHASEIQLRQTSWCKACYADPGPPAFLVVMPTHSFEWRKNELAFWLYCLCYCLVFCSVIDEAVGFCWRCEMSATLNSNGPCVLGVCLHTCQLVVGIYLLESFMWCQLFQQRVCHGKVWVGRCLA